MQSEQIQAPACAKCDDLGTVPGNEVFGAAICGCAVGVTLHSRAPDELRGNSFNGTATEYLATLAPPDRRADERTTMKAAASMESIAKSHAKSIMCYLGSDPQFQPKDMEAMIQRFIVRAMGEAVPDMINKLFAMERYRDAAVAELAEVKAALATAEGMLATARALPPFVELTPAGEKSVLDAMMECDRQTVTFDLAMIEKHSAEAGA